MKRWNGIGVMSGTSLDGLDIALCKLTENNTWSYEITAAKTVDYNSGWKEKLSAAFHSSAVEIYLLDSEFGKFIGEQVRQFIHENKLKEVDFIASHGHTVFHQPEKGMTCQIGSGAAIAAETGITTITDFRSTDVALGGQGAPLVPIGDRLLFSDYNYCLNLGGFANISFEENNTRLAFDNSPCNIILNEICSATGQEYDEGGKLASSGKVDKSLLEQLNVLNFYQTKGAKSLGREWVEKEVLPLINKSTIDVADKLRTVVEHIAFQISRSTERGKVLITGGGAFNSFLITRIEDMSGLECVIPSRQLVEYKEALVFALLGALRLEGKTNILRSVTGARADSCSGCVYAENRSFSSPDQ